MKFIVDKVAVHPPHALTRAEVEALLAVVPENWDLPFSTVHLKATMPGSAGYGNTVTYDISGEGTLTICSRGILPGGIRRDVLRELAILGLHIPPRNGRRIPQAETAEIDTIISPMIDQLNALAPNVTRSPARYSDSFNLVYGALLTHGYP